MTCPVQRSFGSFVAPKSEATLVRGYTSAGLRGEPELGFFPWRFIGDAVRVRQGCRLGALRGHEDLATADDGHVPADLAHEMRQRRRGDVLTGRIALQSSVVKNAAGRAPVPQASRCV